MGRFRKSRRRHSSCRKRTLRGGNPKVGTSDCEDEVENCMHVNTSMDRESCTENRCDMTDVRQREKEQHAHNLKNLKTGIDIMNRYTNPTGGKKKSRTKRRRTHAKRRKSRAKRRRSRR